MQGFDDAVSVIDPMPPSRVDASVKIDVKDLHIGFRTDNGVFNAVRGVSFSLGREKLAIVGESGSGKSTVGRSLLRLHSPRTLVSAERLRFGDVDLLQASEKTMRAIRGRRISMIMQDPKYSLNPVKRIGDQIAEAYLAHHKASAGEGRQRALAMMERVRIRDPLRTANLYPHQISGGMGQRVMIAMMLIPEPEVIIADEPTSALDVSVRMQILEILDEMVDRHDLGLLFISHDLHLVKHFCDRVLIMYAGRVIESIRADALDRAEHPYTRALLDALPSAEHRRTRLPQLQRDPAWLGE